MHMHTTGSQGKLTLKRPPLHPLRGVPHSLLHVLPTEGGAEGGREAGHSGNCVGHLCGPVHQLVDILQRSNTLRAVSATVQGTGEACSVRSQLR